MECTVKVCSAHPYLDGAASGRTQPVSVGAEDQRVDHLSRVARQCVEVLALVQVPQHRVAVLQ